MLDFLVKKKLLSEGIQYMLNETCDTVIFIVIMKKYLLYWQHWLSILSVVIRQ